MYVTMFGDDEYIGKTAEYIFTLYFCAIKILGDLMDLVFLAVSSMFKVESAIRIHGRDVARVQGTRDQIVVCAVT